MIRLAGFLLLTEKFKKYFSPIDRFSIIINDECIFIYSS